MSNAVAYNPDDPLQSGFLSALAQGETGGSSFASTEGVGGSNLAGTPTDQYGFPQWQGLGNSHAAGTYQFQPSTWDSIAQEFNLNFSNPADQNAGAWYLAQQTYSNATGGQSLEDALSSGQYSSVQQALESVWPSVSGNQAAPQGLADSIRTSIGNVQAGTAPGGSASSQGSSGGLSSIPIIGSAISGVENLFIRGGLLLVGGIIIVVSLWFLLSDQGVLPSPKQAASALI